MSVLTNESLSLTRLVAKFNLEYPDINFKSGDTFTWSPKNRTITFDGRINDSDKAVWSLIHELSHGILGHTDYESDFELLKMEVAAWTKAVEVGIKNNIVISEDHIQDCIDTYRDWLHQRSSCPTCNNSSFQENKSSYRCFNCKSSWRVTNSRFCRPYRLTSKS